MTGAGGCARFCLALAVSMQAKSDNCFVPATGTAAGA